MLLESAEISGVSPDALAHSVGMQRADLVAPQRRVEWGTLVRLIDQLWAQLDGDVERLRAVGRHMHRVPAYAPVRRLARAVVSPRTLYDLANRWAVPANFPHIHFTSVWESRSRVRLKAKLPDAYQPSSGFFHLAEGALPELPKVLGLAPARLVFSRVEPRFCEVVLEMPESPSLLSSMRRGIRAALSARDTVAVLEEQREELARNVEASEQARDEMRALLNRLPDLVAVHASGTLLWANEAWLRALGWELSEVVGTSLLETVAERSRAVVLERMQQAATSGGVPVTTAVVLKTRTGRDLFVEVGPVHGVVFDGIPARLVHGRDVTDRMQMQQKLVVADRLASVGLLAAGVAHEVNNPLGYVLNNIEIAQRELLAFEGAGERGRHALSVALEGVDRIRAIVRDLLMLAREDDTPQSPVDVQAVVESTLVLAAREIERNVVLIRDFHPAPDVQGSRARIAQVLLNLISNGLEAMRGQPRDESFLGVRIATASDGRLLLEVSDTGRGISEADLPRIFEPFFTTRPAGQGTGLGLSIAQRLVVELGGEMTVSSVVGQGTTFQILLPPAHHPRAPAEPKPNHVVDART